MICSVSGPKSFVRKYHEFSHRWIDRKQDKREDELGYDQTSTVYTCRLFVRKKKLR